MTLLLLGDQVRGLFVSQILSRTNVTVCLEYILRQPDSRKRLLQDKLQHIYRGLMNLLNPTKAFQRPLHWRQPIFWATSPMTQPSFFTLTNRILLGSISTLFAKII